MPKVRRPYRVCLTLASLGLGVVRDMVEAWGGRLQLLDSPLGGLRVSIELSRAVAVPVGLTPAP